MTIKRKLFGALQAISAFFILALSTTLCFIPIFFLGLLKLLPVQSIRIGAAKIIDSIAKCWCEINNLFINFRLRSRLHIKNDLPLQPNESCYLIANHQSGCDIILLHWLFNRKVPVIRFFIKNQLKWIPLLGYCWWAMGFPFMKRYSKHELTKNPQKKLKDQEAAQKSMTLCRNLPSTIMSFVEGTRFSVEKHRAQKSEFQHLLKPKAGGMSYALATMEQRIKKIVDVTIIYSKEKPSLWDFLTGRIDKIILHLREIHIPDHFLDSGLLHNEIMLTEFRQWLNDRWHEKDQLMMTLQKGS